MRLLRPRFTVRRLMVVVAVVASVLGLGLGGFRLWRLSGTYRAMSEMHRLQAEEVVRGTYFGDSGGSYHIEWPSPDKADHLRLKAKYEHAARPWLPVPPEPR